MFSQQVPVYFLSICYRMRIFELALYGVRITSDMDGEASTATVPQFGSVHFIRFDVVASADDSSGARSLTCWLGNRNWACGVAGLGRVQWICFYSVIGALVVHSVGGVLVDLFGSRAVGGRGVNIFVWNRQSWERCDSCLELKHLRGHRYGFSRLVGDWCIRAFPFAQCCACLISEHSECCGDAIPFLENTRVEMFIARPAFPFPLSLFQ